MGDVHIAGGEVGEGGRGRGGVVGWGQAWSDLHASAICLRRNAQAFSFCPKLSTQSHNA